MTTSEDNRSIAPNNGRAPKTLIGCLVLAVEVIEGLQNDHPDLLNAGLVMDAKNLMLQALHANEYEEAEMRLASLAATDHGDATANEFDRQGEALAADCRRQNHDALDHAPLA